MDNEELLKRIQQLEAKATKSKRDRQVILLLVGGIAALLLAVKFEVTDDGKRSFIFDGSLVNLEFLTQVASFIFIGGAGIRAVTNLNSQSKDDTNEK